MSALADRYREFLAGLGSLRLEGAEPGRDMIALGEAWGRGELTTAELDAATDRIAAAAAQRIAAGQHPPSRPATVADHRPRHSTAEDPDSHPAASDTP